MTSQIRRIRCPLEFLVLGRTCQDEFVDVVHSRPCFVQEGAQCRDLEVDF